MNEIAVRSDTLDAKIEWAKTMSHASLLPQQYQNNPGNLLYAIEYADSLGIDRINAITSIHVISGKPTASADLIASLVRRAGHKLRISGDDTHALAQLIRADDPDFTFEATWDVEKARSAGLWGKGNWKNYPGAMLRSRAITEVARAGASDALYGVLYVPDELGATVDAEGAPVADPGAPMSRQAPAEPDPAEPPITDEQRKKLQATASELGLTREQKIAGAAHYAGREIESTNDLTAHEASLVIDALVRKAESTQASAEATVAEELSGEVLEAEVEDDPNSQWDGAAS